MDIDKNHPGFLDLRGTQITALPDGLTVGGSLDLEGTQITALPDGLTVGGSLDLEGTQITGAQYGCGNQSRTIIAYNHPRKGKVVSLGCFIGNMDECELAIGQKYAGRFAKDYIAKVKAAFAVVVPQNKT